MKELTRCNTITVKSFLVRQLLSISYSLFPNILRLLCGPEAATALLIHLRTGCHAIDGHEEQLLRLDLAEQMLDVIEYLYEHLIFRDVLGS